MSDPVLIILALAVAIGSLLGLAALADSAFRRRRAASQYPRPQPPPRGPIARVLFYIGWSLLALTVLSLAAFFVGRSFAPLWIALGSFIAYFVVGLIYRLAWHAGK